MFNADDYKGLEEFMGPNPPGIASDALLPPHVKAAKVAYHYEQQEQRCYTCDEMGHSWHNCPRWLQAAKDRSNLNSNWALNQGGQRPQK